MGYRLKHAIITVHMVFSNQSSFSKLIVFILGTRQGENGKKVKYDFHPALNPTHCLIINLLFDGEEVESSKSTSIEKAVFLVHSTSNFDHSFFCRTAMVLKSA